MKLLRSAGTFMATAAFGGLILIAQTPAASPLRVSAVSMAKQKVSGSMPEYPVQAREAGVQGVVVLRAQIGASGAVDRVDLVDGDDRLGEAAKDVVLTWTYKPYLLKGEPVAVETVITLAFSLDGPDAHTSSGSGKVSVFCPIRVSAGVMNAMLLRKVHPEYPSDARATGVSGSVMLHAFLSKTGEIEGLSVIAGPELLRDSALQAVRQWGYRPYLLNGEPVEVDTQITVNFDLAPAP